LPRRATRKSRATSCRDPVATMTPTPADPVESRVWCPGVPARASRAIRSRRGAGRCRSAPVLGRRTTARAAHRTTGWRPALQPVTAKPAPALNDCHLDHRRRGELQGRRGSKRVQDLLALTIKLVLADEAGVEQLLELLHALFGRLGPCAGGRQGSGRWRQNCRRCSSGHRR